MNKLLLIAIVALFAFSCSKKESVPKTKDLAITVWYETYIGNSKIAIPDNGAKCYLFKDFNIHDNNFSMNLDGTIKLANGQILQPNEIMNYDGGVKYFSSLNVSATYTVMAVSENVPNEIDAVTTIIRHNDPIQTTNEIKFVF